MLHKLKKRDKLDGPWYKQSDWVVSHSYLFEHTPVSGMVTPMIIFSNG